MSEQQPLFVRTSSTFELTDHQRRQVERWRVVIFPSAPNTPKRRAQKKRSRR
jgi:hypothetical protein